MSKSLRFDRIRAGRGFAAAAQAHGEVWLSVARAQTPVPCRFSGRECLELAHPSDAQTVVQRRRIGVFGYVVLRRQAFTCAAGHEFHVCMPIPLYPAVTLRPRPKRITRLLDDETFREQYRHGSQG